MIIVNQNVSNNSLGFVGALTILFIALRLMHIIHWSWLWVLSPLWIAGLIPTTIFFLMLVWLFYCDYKTNQRRKKLQK